MLYDSNPFKLIKTCFGIRIRSILLSILFALRKITLLWLGGVFYKLGLVVDSFLFLKFSIFLLTSCLLVLTDFVSKIYLVGPEFSV